MNHPLIKRTQLLVLLGMLILPTFAESAADTTAGVQYRQLRLHYENSSGENGVSTFEYDDAGLMTTAIWELLDGSRFSLGHYEYDDSGRLTRKYRTFSDDLTSNEAYEYDADGNLIAEYFERSDSVAGKATYEYDEHGRRLRAICDNFKGWFTGRLDYMYGADGKKTRATIMRDSTDLGEILYVYDSAGHLVREHWDFSGQWSQTFVHEYEIVPATPPARYASSNVFTAVNSDYRVVAETYDYANETGGPSYFTYSDDGKLTGKRFVRSNGLSTETTFLYDGRGQLTRSYREYSQGLSGVFGYEFNGHGQLVKRTFHRSDGKSGSEIYEYDDHGDLTRAELDNFDNWLTGTITFSYDGNGRLAAGFFKGKNDFDASISFEHDSAGNPVRIHWEFTSGKAQTYTFEYEKIE